MLKCAGRFISSIFDAFSLFACLFIRPFICPFVTTDIQAVTCIFDTNLFV